MGLLGRLRSGSETTRVPPYLTASQVFERTLSAPDLLDKSLRLHELGRDLAAIVACLYLEDGSGVDLQRPIAPPEYKHLAPLLPRYPIHPRDEEGQEALPGYSSSVWKQGLAMRKQELNNPFQPSTSRSWTSVHMVLNNTKLDVYSTGKRNSRDPSGYRVGVLIRSYTLQYAEVGLAVDYTKRPFVIRVRAESEQFLVHCANEEECVQWTNAIQMGIDLALPLDERKLPKNRSIPRRRSRSRRRESGRRSSAGHDVDELHLRPISTSMSSMTAVSRSSTRSSTAEEERLASILSAFTYGNDPRSQNPRISFAAPPSRQRDAYNEPANACPLSRVSSGASSVLEQVETNQDETEGEYDEEDTTTNRTGTRLSVVSFSSAIYKWNPCRQFPSRTSVMRYAQRCLGALPANTPWLNKKVVIKGKCYIIREGAFEKVGRPAPMLVR
jgi:hypothetical protein